MGFSPGDGARLRQEPAVTSRASHSHPSCKKPASTTALASLGPTNTTSQGTASWVCLIPTFSMLEDTTSPLASQPLSAIASSNQSACTRSSCPSPAHTALGSLLFRPCCQLSSFMNNLHACRGSRMLFPPLTAAKTEAPPPQVCFKGFLPVSAGGLILF